MPRGPPCKKSKMQKSIKDFFSPGKLTDSKNEERRVLQNVGNVKERFNPKNNKKGLTNDLRQNAEGQSHTFQFRFKNKHYAVACDTSQTVLGALTTNKMFRKFKEENIKKETVLRRSKGEVPGAAVKTDFPCCLIDKDEIIDVTFIKKDDSTCAQQKTTKPISFPSASKNLVTFYIKTKGKGKIKIFMKNKQLWKNDVEYVCVYAFKKDKLKTALKRDGRFSDVIFKKRCTLSEFGIETVYLMSHPVRDLDQKKFLVNINSANNDPDSQEDLNEPSAANAKENVDPKPLPTPRKLTTHSIIRPTLENIPDSKETWKILCDQTKDIRQKIKQQKNFRDNAQVKKFIKTEYDKSIQSFSEVKTVKKLMSLSNSVCQIRIDGSAKGTGFLLFDRFILTNAHVIDIFHPFTRKLSKTYTAVFGFEDLDSETKRVAIKEHAAAYFHGKDDMNRHLDFALLELDVADKCLDVPELFSFYSSSSPSNRSGICIVGHPDGGVKKMDLCFIIGKENQLMAAQEHISENYNFYHAITQQSLAGKWEMHENQISYDSCFFHGSSGSPVFDEDCRLIGIHTGGYVYPGEGGKTRSIMEYGYSMQPILECIIKQVRRNGRSDVLKLMSEFKSYLMEDNDVEMTEEPQNQDE
ncbi:serine protease FAM111A-like [Paramisgurnus dabryanus]|uniref:serine protease FAM111A-like n=1 Tax=Paramisgurnus dabryanus TaxID=90735 RepID=UPI0031F374C6